jgi:signal peptidase I
MNSKLNWIPIRGDCMWPTLRAGDRAEWEPVSSRLAPGMVVVARGPAGLVAHRVLAADGAKVILSGDNARCADPPLPARAILGEITRVSRDNRLLERSQWDGGRSLFGRLRWATKSAARALWGALPR